MPLDLRKCHPACIECIKQYTKKHRLKYDKDHGFKIKCTGIPKEYIPESVLASLGNETGGDNTAAISMLDPVTWASSFLDWHCLDPDGEHWKRKHEERTLGGFPPYDETTNAEERSKEGKSIFHRPYQEIMLQCTAKRKVFRLGRQLGKTESLCIVILYHIFTHSHFQVEVITPYQSQIDLIFKRISELIQSNTTLTNSIARSVKAPQYTIELKNGSQIIGFTAGTRSGQDAGASRGQHANMLVFDECDYLSPADIDAALAVIINYPNATVWMSSTPTGKREKFFETCKNPLYREFHHSSEMNPNWGPDLEEYYHSELTEAGYDHEIHAIFGEQEEGVYQLKYVMAAQEQYEYGHFTPNPKWNYMIGVDWNDYQTGTTIAVIGFDPKMGFLYLVDKATVSRAEQTQLAACQKIAELNRLWNPDYIYVDQGFGSTQIEVLHDYGYRSIAEFGPNHPDSRLRNIVKAYDFGSSIEVRDPFTKQMTKKPAKPFLIENSVRKFESGQFRYPMADETFTNQLLGYVIDRVSMTGRPVYVQQNEKAGDHFLDAVNLALVAFTLEKTQLGKPVFSQKIALAGRFGEGNVGSELQEKHRPKGGRAGTTDNSTLLGPATNDLPASNVMVENTTKIWQWPGFGHDAPRPKPRTMREACSDAERRVGIRKPGRTRPQRKKF